MNLNLFLNQGIITIANTVARYYLGNKKGRKFMLRIAAEFHKDAQIRDRYEADMTHIPPFLIASIASECNLYCTGCYARANGSCGSEAETQMSANEWYRLFREASDIGVSFILLAGGEPLLRRDVIEAAAGITDIIFPIFTNGTIIDEDYFRLFDVHRNLIPVLSIEGDAEQTDKRRGQGVSHMLTNTAKRLCKNGILFGVSITVTANNYMDVSEEAYVSLLRENGCGIIFYVEYVPVEANTDYLLLSDGDLHSLRTRLELLRADKRNNRMIILSFPGDEEMMGGCLAAGRGFFHINPAGGAEPCPFSPFSAINLREQSLLDALCSPFFEKVRAISAAEALNHKGGCTLFQYSDDVRNSLSETKPT